MSSFVHLIDQRRLIGPGGSTVSGSIFFYYTGTSVLAPVYLDPSLEVPSTNPVVVGAGEIVPTLFLDDNIVYRRVIIYSDGSSDEQDPLGVLFSEGEIGLPVGAILDYSGPTAPTGFLFCAGQEVSRTTYSDLFSAIGTTYGAGNGSTTFNLPDTRGRVIAGKDNMGGSAAGRLTSPVNGLILGSTGGEESHLLSIDEIPAHTHTGTTSAPSGVSATGKIAASYGGVHLGNTGFEEGQGGSDWLVGDATHTHTFTSDSTGGDDPHNNVQPTIVVNKIIKVEPTTFLSLLSLSLDLTNKANASAVGVAPTATNMGRYSGSTISDDQTAKENIQQLEMAVEARAELSVLASPDPGEGSDLINFAGKTIEPEVVQAIGSSTFGVGFDTVTSVNGRFTLGALNGPMSFGDLQYCGIQNFGRYNIDGNYAAIQHTTDDSCALFGFFKARGTQTAPSTVVVNDDVGELSFHAWDGTTFVKGALMTPIVKSISAGIASMSIRFWTMDSGGVLRNAVDIDEAQKLNAYFGFDSKWTTAGGSAIRAYYNGSTGGGAEIRTSNGFSSTVPVYGFWFNNTSGIGNPATNVTSVISNGSEALRVDASGNLIVAGTAAHAKTTLNGSVAFQPPVYAAGTSYSVGTNDYSIVFSNAGTITVTLPSAASAVGRILKMKTIGGGAVNSASSNVTPLASGPAGTAILATTSGKWAELQSDGTNWVILQGN